MPSLMPDGSTSLFKSEKEKFYLTFYMAKEEDNSNEVSILSDNVELLKTLNTNVLGLTLEIDEVVKNLQTNFEIAQMPFDERKHFLFKALILVSPSGKTYYYPGKLINVGSLIDWIKAIQADEMGSSPPFDDNPPHGGNPPSGGNPPPPSAGASSFAENNITIPKDLFYELMMDSKKKSKRFEKMSHKYSLAKAEIRDTKQKLIKMESLYNKKRIALWRERRGKKISNYGDISFN